MTNLRTIGIVLLHLLVPLVVFTLSVHPEDFNVTNITLNATDITNSSFNLTGSNMTVEDTNIINNETNQTNETIKISDWNITRILPSSAKIGEVQLNIQVENTGNQILKDLSAMVKGDGFSTYSQEIIDTLAPGQKSYIILETKFEKAGNISLSISIAGNQFAHIIQIIDPVSKADAEKLKAEEDALKAKLQELSVALNESEAGYDSIESDYDNKRSANFDVSNIRLDDLKSYIRDAQKSLVQKDAIAAEASLALAAEESSDITAKLEAAKPIKKTFLQVLNENAVLISTIAGAIIAFITLYEILKKKKEGLYKKIKEMNVDKNTKIVIEQKKDDSPK